MNENEVIERLRRKVPSLRGSALVAGIGDDCAIYRVRGAREDLLLTTDLVLEDVHFRRDAHPARALGHKVLARGLSDIAAMGGAPRFCLVSLALGEWCDRRWLNSFYRGLLNLGRRTGTFLAGGDLALAEKVACDIVVCGDVPRNTALRRDGARPGDRIYVSGSLGASALGLDTRRGAAWKRHLQPEPRLAVGRFLRTRLKATACLDLSDGLSIDLHRLCLASGAAAAIDAPLPVFPGARLEHALHGGEDYELLFTVRPGTRVPASCGGVPLSRIGVIRDGNPGDVTLFGRYLPPLGWDHFRKP